jgi:uncharacterized protein YigE (DUF2233 family)
MADVFLSYKREDLVHAKAIAQAATDEGFSVFFDVHDDVGIRAGESWDQRLEYELGSTKAVIVLWSRRSVASDNVRDEARRAAARGILVPVMLDDCEVPLGLGILQAADLRQWSGDRQDPQWRFLIDRGVRNIVSELAHIEVPALAALGKLQADTGDFRPWRRLGAIAIASFVVISIIMATVYFSASNRRLCDGQDASCQTDGLIATDGATQPSGIDVFVATLQLSDDNDSDLKLLRTNIERNLVELLWRNDLRVAHALTPKSSNKAKFDFEGSIVRVDDDIFVYLLMREDGQIAGSAEVTAPLSEFQEAYRSLPAALLYFMNRNPDTFEPMIMTQRPTKSVRAWWMFEEAKRLASSQRTNEALEFLDKAMVVDAKFATALWTKGDLLDSNGVLAGESIKQSALAASPDLQRHSIHAAPIDPMPAIRMAALSSKWVELEEGLLFRRFAAEEYAIVVTAWTIDSTKFEIEAKSSVGISGEKVEQIRQREGAILAVNGGFWDQDGAGRVTPSGLFITDSIVLKPYVDGAGSGVFLMTKEGPRIQYSKDPLPTSVSSAVQAGPIVIEPSGEIGIRTKNAVRSERTAVCATSSGLVMFMAVEGGISLYELAALLGAPDNALGFDCTVALNLGGGPTSQASFRYESKSVEIAGLWNTQSALVVTRR